MHLLPSAWRDDAGLQLDEYAEGGPESRGGLPPVFRAYLTVHSPPSWGFYRLHVFFRNEKLEAH